MRPERSARIGPADPAASLSPLGDQDLHSFLESYRKQWPEDVLVVDERLSRVQDVTALTTELWSRGRAPMLLCRDVEGLDAPVLTNVFASRQRIARILGTTRKDLLQRFHEAAARRIPPTVVDDGPILHTRETDNIDLTTLPMLVHFAEDAGPYLTSAIVIARDPDTGIGNASYHRCMVATATSLATSLHSRGHLWRHLVRAKERGETLPVAVVLGGHPIFMLASAARVALEVDELAVAGGLFRKALEVVATPLHSLLVPAYADFVLEGELDPAATAPEGPFGEYTGYASHRSTNNVIEVRTILRRESPILLDVVSGNAADHLNLGRIPRESELFAKLRERFPDVTAMEFPASGTHFHCYVSLRPGASHQARQLVLTVLGLDPYVKLAVAVDDDIDVSREEEVLWAIATRFQAASDLIVVPSLPGSLLDPSSAGGATSRMAIDATRGEGFEGRRITLSPDAIEKARRILSEGDLPG